MLDYIKFVKERMSIWYKKEVLKLRGPWTRDKILQTAKFCNIYRELDRVTRFELAKLKEQESNPINQLEFILKLRVHNSPETYNALEEGDGAYLHNGEANGTLVSDSMICWQTNFGDISQLNWIMSLYGHIEFELHELYNEIQNSDTPEEVVSTLIRLWEGRKEPYPDFIKFWAYEIYTSLTYCSWFKFDEDSYVFVGPGCKPGLTRMFGYSLDSFESAYKVTKRWLESDVSGDLIWIPENLQPRNPTPKKFTKRVFEHSLCEWRKYFQVVEGKPIRRIYNPMSGV